MSCASEHEIAMFVDKTLGVAERARVTRHLDSCPDCRTVVAELAQLHHDARRPPSPVAHAHAHKTY